jgi:hypothetical protein
MELMNVVDNFGAVNMRISKLEKSIFEEIHPSKFRELPKIAKEIKHSLTIIEEAILLNHKAKLGGFQETTEASDLQRFTEELKRNFTLCDQKFLKMQRGVEQFKSLFKECLRVSDFKDKEDLILILKKENEVKQKLLDKYKRLVRGTIDGGQSPEERDFDLEFNKRFRTSTTFVKLLQEENAYLMSKNAEISEKVLASKMEINQRLEKIQKDMREFWKSLSSATGKDASFGVYGKKKKGLELALAEFGRHKSDFKKMILRHEKFVEQVAKSGDGVLIEIQKEFGRFKKMCKGFHFLDIFKGKWTLQINSRPFGVQRKTTQNHGIFESKTRYFKTGKYFGKSDFKL